MESNSSKRSEFTLCPKAYGRGLIVSPLWAWWVVGVYMGMIVGCSASSPLPWERSNLGYENLVTMETIVVDGLVVGQSGRHGAIQVLQGVSVVVHMQKDQTQTTPGKTMVSAHKVSIK